MISQLFCPNISKLKCTFIFLLTFTLMSLVAFYVPFPVQSNFSESHPEDSSISNLVLQFNEATTEKIMNESDYVHEATKTILNLPDKPFILGSVAGGPRFLQNGSCALFPHVFRLQFDNVYWQVQKHSNWTFYLFGAYWDIRTLNETEGSPSVQILGMMDRTDENITTHYCQVWFANKGEPLIAEISHYRYVWNKKWGNYKDGELQPYIFNCLMPQNYTDEIPTSVSIVPSPCSNATNNLRIHFEKPEKKEMFGVCVKGMDFIRPDWSVRVIEWIELLHILGVNKIYFYDLAVHPNMHKVFKYYEDLNMIELLPLSHPGGIPNEPYLRHSFLKRMITVKRQHELIPYNDCVYRNMYKYEYISLLDLDEIIVPHRGLSSWLELAAFLQSGRTDQDTNSFMFENVIFSGTDRRYIKNDEANIPDYMYMLQHTTRNSKEIGKGSGIKCFLRPENILTMHNHWPTSCVKKCKPIYVNITDGFLHHYRTKNAGGMKVKDDEVVTFVVDETLWQWKDELISRSNKAIRQLNLLDI